MDSLGEIERKAKEREAMLSNPETKAYYEKILSDALAQEQIMRNLLNNNVYLRTFIIQLLRTNPGIAMLGMMDTSITSTVLQMCAATVAMVKAWENAEKAKEQV